MVQADQDITIFWVYYPLLDNFPLLSYVDYYINHVIIIKIIIKIIFNIYKCKHD